MSHHYPDATFDLVVSSLAIHNIRSNAGRKRAIVEGFRVLKPGGRIVIADIRATTIYEEALRALGESNVVRRRLEWRFWWGNPFAGTTPCGQILDLTETTGAGAYRS